MKPVKVRKKPVVVEAMQYHWWEDFALEWVRSLGGVVILDQSGWNVPVIKIQTLEGLMEVKDGAWIIRGVRGEFYPCDPDIFSETYELAEEQYDDGE